MRCLTFQAGASWKNCPIRTFLVCESTLGCLSFDKGLLQCYNEAGASHYFVLAHVEQFIARHVFVAVYSAFLFDHGTAVFSYMAACLKLCTSAAFVAIRQVSFQMHTTIPHLTASLQSNRRSPHLWKAMESLDLASLSQHGGTLNSIQ